MNYSRLLFQIGAVVNAKITSIVSGGVISQLERVIQAHPGNNRHESILLNALKEFYNTTTTSVELDGFNAIEALRMQMLHNKELLRIEDYGAGSSTENEKAAIKTRSVRDICANTSKSQKDCKLLYQIVKALRPISAIELGTSLGISAAYQGLAIKISEKGEIVTLEGATECARVAQTNFDTLGLKSYIEIVAGKFDDTLENVLLKLDRVQYAFVDGHHDEKATLRYTEKILPYMREGGIMVFDDVLWSPGMLRAWKTIQASRWFDTNVQIRGLGIGILNGK